MKTRARDRRPDGLSRLRLNRAPARQSPPALRAARPWIGQTIEWGAKRLPNERLNPDMWRYVERVGGIYGIKVRICHRINVLGGRNGNPEM